MIKAVIVEDESGAASELERALERYGAERHEDIAVTVYDNALRFLDAYRADADIVFMDIEMPDLDGMSAAEKIRSIL